MYITHQQDVFSQAFLSTIAAATGLKSFPRADPDDDSIDGTIGYTGRLGTMRSPRIDFQLKCHMAKQPSATEIPYALSVKNYDDLRHIDYHVPRFLFLVIVPNRLEHWLRETASSVLMRRAGFWMSLRGMPAVDNTTKVTVHVPARNRITRRALLELVGAHRL